MLLTRQLSPNKKTHINTLQHSLLIEMGVGIRVWASNYIQPNEWDIITHPLALCSGNSSVTGEFPSQIPVTQSFDVFFGPRLSGRLSTHSGRQWFQTASRSLWRHCNDDEAFRSAGAVCGNPSPKVSQGVPHGLPIRVKYGVPFVRYWGEKSFSILHLCCVQYHVIPNCNVIESVLYLVQSVLSSCQWCVFCTADPVCRESAGHQWLSSQGTSIAGVFCSSLHTCPDMLLNKQ